ncbi:MAG: betC 3 [Lacunisphaera sp.]|nr:betC 3 [Lacunisphaera sp.]
MKSIPLGILCAAGALAAGLALGAAPCLAAESVPLRPNVLFIMADDLNHWVGYTGRNQQTLTPNIDRLSAMGMSFTHANCAAPVCNSSRAALFSGLRPGSTGVYGNSQDWRPAIAPELTLITTLRRGGYEMLGAGKLYHGGFDRREEFNDYLVEKPAPHGTPLVKPQRFTQVVFAPLEGGDEVMPDFNVANYGIAQLAKPHDKPFFLGIGFHKPHPPFMVPKKYFDMHPLESIELPPYREDDLEDIPRAGQRKAIGAGTHEAIVKAGQWKAAVQSYLATISFVDAQVGRVLDALEKSPYRDNTIVVLLGDHGWELGEKHHWGKTTLWEEVARAPLIWKVPGLTKPGSVCARTVDFMSLYPTLTELCGVPTPKHVQGISIKPLLADAQSPWDHPAVTTSQEGQHSVRTEQWRYIRYQDGTDELYDETADPYEWTNLAGKKELAGVIQELAVWLPKENKAGLKTSAGGEEEGEGPAAKEDRAERRKARQEKKAP